jgi:hydrogenase expression/formation protein HypE
VSLRPLSTGKVPAALLRELLPSAAELPPEIRLAPAIGEDACAIDLPAGTLVVATDPITLTGTQVGAYAVAINANDVAVTGVRPRWFLAVLLLPEGTTEGEVRAVFEGTRRALAEVGACLVGGHTEVTKAVSQPVVVGQMLGFAESGAVVATGGVRVGDAIVQVGPAPVEGAAVLAAECPERLAGLDPALVERARDATREPGISVVEPALLSAHNGATALHDPTEGGLSAGLHELAEASGLRLEVNPEAVCWFEPGAAVCAALGANPWGTLASGALLAAFPPARLEAALGALEERRFDARVIGRAAAGSGVVLRDGRALARFDRDEVARLLATR